MTEYITDHESEAADIGRAADQRDQEERDERARWDGDDRTRCTCKHLDWDGTPGRGDKTVKVQCLNSTRHPSGKCADCRGA